MSLVQKSISPEAYFGYTISLDSAKLYAELGNPSAKQIPHLVAEHIDSHFYGESDPGKNARLLEAGIRDSQGVFLNSLSLHPRHFNYDEAAGILSHQQTLATLALIGLQSESRILSMTQSSSATDYYRINATETAIMATDKLLELPPRRGCPHAGNNPESLPTPLYNRFAKWSGELALELYSRESNTTVSVFR